MLFFAAKRRGEEKRDRKEGEERKRRKKGMIMIRVSVEEARGLCLNTNFVRDNSLVQNSEKNIARYG